MSVKTVTGEEDLMLMTASGVMIRMAVSDISVMGRNTQGVKLMRLDGENEQEYVATVAKVPKEEEKEQEQLQEE
ncbi:DNA gyrase subunit A [Anoxybacillus sp. BCO1]|nr:DNA gyrase subunit A [Anoxybacillus sp. BCO1]